MSLHELRDVSLLHLATVGAVVAVVGMSVYQTVIVELLRHAIHRDFDHVRLGEAQEDPLHHPLALALRNLDSLASPPSPRAVEQATEFHDVQVFVPIKSKVALLRDVSTLLGLIATCASLVAAGLEFAKHGRAELLVGSVASGTISTCLAAIACAFCLRNLSLLTRLRVRVAADVKEYVDDLGKGHPLIPADGTEYTPAQPIRKEAM